MILSRPFSSLPLPVLAFLSLSARTSPHFRAISRMAALKLTVKVSSNGIKAIAASDRARAQALVQGSGNSFIDASNGNMICAANIGVETPPTYYTLLIDNTGELTFGGYDASKTTGSVNYVPITLVYPSSGYWGIDQSIGYGGPLIFRGTAGNVGKCE